MPIVEPPSFDALGLVSFQINPHYLDPDPASTHKGETREERILQFLEENATPVIGLREPSMLRIVDDDVTLVGTTTARLFRRGVPSVEVEPGPLTF
jgi:dipeptidase E